MTWREGGGGVGLQIFKRPGVAGAVLQIPL